MPDARETLETVRGPDEVRARTRAWRQAGLTVGFVPTMGALHEGHLSLVRRAKRSADRVIASVFVNPAQFAPGEDFDAYPRDEAGDARQLLGAGCDLLYAPARHDMYPTGHATAIAMKGPALGLESDERPHFFGGVASVVAKLFNQVEPDLAVFGEKDYQQLMVIRRLVADLDFPIEIVGAPTQREPDGLALSSRNAYLTSDQRQIAGALNRVLARAAAEIRTGPLIAHITDRAAAALIEAGFDAVDYVAIRDAETLGVLAEPIERPARILAAARIGEVRLIDNLPA